MRAGQHAHQTKPIAAQHLITFAARGGLFVPGVFFLLIGVITVVAPKFLAAALASFFLFVGFLCCLLAWKMMGWRRRIEKFARGIEGKIIVQAAGSESGEPFETLGKGTQREPETGKKIVIH